MAIYRVRTPATGTGGVGNKVHQAFASSEGAAKKERRRLAEAHGFKLDEVKYAPIDLKSGKAGFISYMNANAAELPADYKPGTSSAVADSAPAEKAGKKPKSKAKKKK